MMRSFITKDRIIILLVLIAAAQYFWSAQSKAKIKRAMEQELALVVAERDTISIHAQGLYSKWLVAVDKLEEQSTENARLESLASALQLEVTQKQQLIFTQEKIIEDLSATVDTITDSTTGIQQDKVSFRLHQDGVSIQGFTLNPPGSAHLEIEHDPIRLDIHLTRSASGTFHKGLIDTPPWLHISDWNVILHDGEETSPSVWSQMKRSLAVQIGGFAGPGGHGIPVAIGCMGWNGGVVATDNGISYMVTKTFYPLSDG